MFQIRTGKKLSAVEDKLQLPLYSCCLRVLIALNFVIVNVLLHKVVVTFIIVVESCCAQINFKPKQSLPLLYIV